ILIQGAASNNQIGSATTGEANVISGNKFEGVTISGAATNNNIVIGNLVGAAGVGAASKAAGSRSFDDLGSEIGGRASVGNGSAGVFLSKGTQDTRVGGDNGEGNGVGNNGGNGVEVRATNSKHNSARKNGISKNRTGGIKLFD